MEPRTHLTVPKTNTCGSEPRTQCVKVAELRKIDRNMNLRIWLTDPKNMYVGRGGRLFIDQEVFFYPHSKWGNPFKVGEYTVSSRQTWDCSYAATEALSKYRDHVLNSSLKNDLHELAGKTLGCFCLQDGPCHAKVLVELFKILN